MTARSIRRLPVVQEGKLVGVVTLGDLAPNTHPTRRLGEISSASVND